MPLKDSRKMSCPMGSQQMHPFFLAPMQSFGGHKREGREFYRVVGNISVRFKKHLPVWSAGHFEDVSEIYRLFCIAICLGGRKVSRCDECSLELLRLNFS